MTTPLLQAENVTKVLGTGAGRVEALREVTISLAGGELTLLMGPSGSGKTTLLSILGCMLSPTSGTVRVLGHATVGANPEQLTDLRREHIGFVFQSYHLFPMLTAEENVRIALDVCGEPTSTQSEKAKAALAGVGLAQKADSFPSELSSGEQQRVAIARAIAGNASAILADEPTAALDSSNGRAIMALLSKIAKDPTRTVLVVTHDPRVLQFADRIVYLEDGRILEEKQSHGDRKVASIGRR